ncbi:MAG: hypothetical protein GY858_00920 [Candidatus Omnitrophica bacterium]|nr:hypothetical protein [Candidatus Omnitrophota bacterium]
MKIKKIINSKIFLLVLGFLLTGVVGTFLNYQFQKETWKRESQHEIAKRHLDQSRQVIEEVLLHISKRFYAMQKVLWELESERFDGARLKWKNYAKIKDDWNINVGLYRSRIKILIDENLAYELLDKNNARDYSDRESLHALFVVTHYKIKDFFDYRGKNEQKRKQLEDAALNSLIDLGHRIGNFSDKCYGIYMGKYDLFKNNFQ